MREVAQPWDLPRLLLRHWRAPQHPRSVPATCPGPSAGTRWAICCKSQPQCHLLPGMPTLLPPCHILCDLQGLADISET